MPNEQQQVFTPIQALTTGVVLVDETSGAVRHGKLGGFRLADLRATLSLIQRQFEALDRLLGRLEVQHPDHCLLLELELAPAELGTVLRIAAWARALGPAAEIRVVGPDDGV